MFAKLAAGLLVCFVCYVAAYRAVRMVMGTGGSRAEPTQIVDGTQDWENSATADLNEQARRGPGGGAAARSVVPAAPADVPPPFVDARHKDTSRLPVFPDVGAGFEVEPGVTWQKVKLMPERAFINDPPPGHLQTLWLYLPKGEHRPGSLPCVLIAPAGSTLLTGNAWEEPGGGRSPADSTFSSSSGPAEAAPPPGAPVGDEGRHPEHLPYVRAGFAVLGYELDGAIREDANQGQFLQGVRKFVDARAGEVDAHIAVEFLKAKVPQVDPGRIFAAGHSSAGTAALLVAASEPGIAGCVAFAPCIDVRARFARTGDVDAIISDLKKAVPGAEVLFTTYSPIENESKIRCPIFLFHAQDDENVPIDESRAFVRRMPGGQVTLIETSRGGHYQAMIDGGIERAIQWLREDRHALGQAAAPTTP